MTTVIIINDSFTVLCNALAQQIEIAGQQSGVPYNACQSKYGVTWECLIGGKWIRRKNIGSATDEAEAVRFSDCDGERSDEARSVTEILEVAKAWIEINLAYHHDE